MHFLPMLGLLLGQVFSSYPFRFVVDSTEYDSFLRGSKGETTSSSSPISYLACSVSCQVPLRNSEPIAINRRIDGSLSVQETPHRDSNMYSEMKEILPHLMSRPR